MKDSAYQVVVIGAGPGGAAAAIEACRLGLGPVLLLDRASWPRDKPCGGGISPRGRSVLREMGVWPQIERDAYPVRGLRLVSPSGCETVLAGAESASVLNRRRLDAILVDAAIGAGATFLPGTKVTAIRPRGEGTVGVCADGGEIAARWVVAADGANGRFGSDERPRALLHTAIAAFEGVPFSPQIVEMIFDPELAPHYGWLFPETSTRANIGICIAQDKLGKRSIRDLFDRFVDRRYAHRLGGATQVGPVAGHPISTTTSVRHRAPDGVLLAGEAARLANCATGEGISYALSSGRLAARAISEGERGRASRREVAREYETALIKTIGRGLGAAPLFCRFGTRALDVVTGVGNLSIVKHWTGKALARV